MKIRVGILFGGVSKEREISFAGGRTVYDNLDKELFEPIPIFVDSFGKFILLNWEYVYKGSIRDFYPPLDMVPASVGDFQVYAESLNPSLATQEEMALQLGQRVGEVELKKIIDFAFLCLHGPYGEDGRIQGMLEYWGIPYSGSGVLPSIIGIDKVLQKKLMAKAGFATPNFFAVKRKDWFGQNSNTIYEKAVKEIGFPLVVKSATQGSSIGITILQNENVNAFTEALNKSFFTRTISAEEWKIQDKIAQIETIRLLTDIREGIGMPVIIHMNDEKETIFHPDVLLVKTTAHFSKYNSSLFFESLDSEAEVLLEGFIEGKEFSCIVIEDEEERAVALPPTEIRKGKELFDYRSKYLPGLARKITPIELPEDQIEKIRKECERLFSELSFDVYARIDGFIAANGVIYLNDPNTTSGMMPSSFFFHQAAEIGLNPSQFLTFILRTSLRARIRADKNAKKYDHLLMKLDDAMRKSKSKSEKKLRVAVILGGYSSERHISVESGRNIYEKLSSSTKYAPFPVFLSGNNLDHQLFIIPINVLLKDNADDIKDKIDNWKVHPVVQRIIDSCTFITQTYSTPDSLAAPRKINYEELAQLSDAVFLGLHGRPGEDGAVQEKLDAFGIPYNGSGKASSEITIDKFRTNELLLENGLLTASHLLISEEDWNSNREKTLKLIDENIKWPFIAKPVDDGCSSAVRRIKTKLELETFAKLIFRKTEDFDPELAAVLKIKAKEEFPRKKVFLIEELISKKTANHFLEITGGLLTKYNAKGEIDYEVFEASEALSEGEVLSLEEKFLAGQGQNITPARYALDPQHRQQISDQVKATFSAAARLLNIQGYARIDAFVRVYTPQKIEIIFIEVNSLPGMTPATCIFHQAAINAYKPYDFIDRILDFSFERKRNQIKQSV